METEMIINVIVVGIVLAVVLYVEMFMYKKPPTAKEFADFEETWMTIQADYKNYYNINESKNDAKTQLLETRRDEKGSVPIFAGMILGIILLILFFAEVVSINNIMTIFISAIVLISYGIIKMADSRKFAILFLIALLAFGTLINFALYVSMAISPYIFLYLVGLILLLAVFSVTRIKEEA